MVAQLAPERDFRGPGCSDLCRVIRCFQAGVFGRQEILVHDPKSHEAYGRLTADPSGSATVLSGPLTIDLGAMKVSVNGREIVLSATELRLLIAIAMRRGNLAETHVLMREVFDMQFRRFDLRDGSHIIRVNLSRIRGKLGRAKSLIETIKGVGYRLQIVAPGAEAPPFVPLSGPVLPPGTWAIEYEACRGCKSNERPHKARGYCSSCYERWKRGTLAGGAS